MKDLTEFIEEAKRKALKEYAKSLIEIIETYQASAANIHEAEKLLIQIKKFLKEL